LVVLLATVACGKTAVETSAQERSGGQGKETIVDTLFDLCRKDDVAGARELLSSSTTAQMTRLVPTMRSSGADPWNVLVSVLKKLHRPSCTPGTPDESGGYPLHCRNLGREFELSVVVEDGKEKLLLPSLQPLFYLY